MKQNNVKLGFLACGPICFCNTMGLEDDKFDNLYDKSKVKMYKTR